MEKIDLKNIYSPIDSKARFNKQHFTEAYEKVSGLEKTLSSLQTNSHDAQAIADAGTLLHSNSNFYLRQNQPGIMAQRATSFAAHEGNGALFEYTTRNAKALYDVLDVESKAILGSSAPMKLIADEKVTNDGGAIDRRQSTFNKNYNKFVKQSNILTELKALGTQNSRDALADRIEFIRIQAQYTPTWRQKMIETYSGNQKLIDSLFQEYLVQVSSDRAALISNADGEVDKQQLSNFMDKNFILQNKAQEKDETYFQALGALSYNSFIKEREESEKQAAA